MVGCNEGYYPKKILKRSIDGMREMKGYACIEYLRWKRSYHYFNMNL
jgi:hypothetical protein